MFAIRVMVHDHTRASRSPPSSATKMRRAEFALLAVIQGPKIATVEYRTEDGTPECFWCVGGWVGGCAGVNLRVMLRWGGTCSLS